MTAREEELTARYLLANPEEVDVYLKQKRWSEVAALVRFTHREVSTDLASTDPALYRTLREQITRFFLLGGGRFSLDSLEQIAGERDRKCRT